MSETVNTYLLDNPDSLIPMDREAFYAEQIPAYQENGRPTRAIDVVAILIFNSRGELMVQKRNYHKAHNPGLIDKSMGGHIRYGDGPDFTVMMETVQELQTPSIVLATPSDFQKALDLLQNYLQTIAIVKHIQTKIYTIQKIFSEKEIGIANRLHLYFGLYDGSVKPADREAQGVLWYSLEDLKNEIKKFPNTFSFDLRFLLTEYEGEIKAFCTTVHKVHKDTQ